MDPRAGTALRYGRALLLALVALVFGAVAHVTAGGLVPGAAAVAAVALPLVAVNAWLLARQAGALRLCVLLVVEQTVVHGGLTAAAGHAGAGPHDAGGATPTTGTFAWAESLAHGDPRSGSFRELAHAAPGADLATLALPGPVQHVLADLTGANALMALGHTLAAVAVGLWLACGERALWTVLGLTVGRVRDTVLRRVLALDLAAVARRAAESTTVRPRPPGPEPDLPPRSFLVPRAVHHRGPPALLAA